MARDITSAVLVASSSLSSVAYILAEFEFDSGPLYLWSGVGDIVWNGKTYSGTGNLGSISEIQETQLLQAPGITYGLSGVPSSLISIAMTEKYKGRPCRHYLAFVASNAGNVMLEDDSGEVLLEDGGFFQLEGASSGQLLDDPVPLFKGFMDVMEIETSRETATIKLSAENALIRLKRTKERRYTDADQKAKYPNDTGLSRINQLQDVRLSWGAASPK